MLAANTFHVTPSTAVGEEYAIKGDRVWILWLIRILAGGLCKIQALNLFAYFAVGGYDAEVLEAMLKSAMERTGAVLLMMDRGKDNPLKIAFQMYCGFHLVASFLLVLFMKKIRRDVAAGNFIVSRELIKKDFANFSKHRDKKIAKYFGELEARLKGIGALNVKPVSKSLYA